MSQKKKIIIGTLVCITLLISACLYSLSRAQVERDRVVSWIEENGGNVEFEHEKWVEKLPGWIKGLVEKVVPPDITVVSLSDKTINDISILENLAELQNLGLSGTQISQCVRYTSTHKIALLSADNSNSIVYITILDSSGNIESDVHLPIGTYLSAKFDYDIIESIDKSIYFLAGKHLIKTDSSGNIKWQKD